MRTPKATLTHHDPRFGPVVVRQGKSWSMSKRFRYQQGILKRQGLLSTRHCEWCLQGVHKERIGTMPKLVEDKVGSRNREKSANTIELLFEWEDILNPDGDFYDTLMNKGLELEEGEDYNVLTPDGEITHMKSAPEKVRNVLREFFANELNVPTTVKVPPTGASQSASSRNWIRFRPRLDTPFESPEAKDEYLEG